MRYRFGHISLAAVLVCAYPLVAAAASVHVIHSEAKLRAEPWIGGAVVATVTQGMLLDVLGENGIWLHVRVPEADVSGYIQRQAVEDLPPAPIPTRPALRPPARVRPGSANLPQRVVLYLGGLYLPQALSFNEQRTFKDPLETTTIEPASFGAQYSQDRVAGFDAGARVRIAGPVGLSVAYSRFKRTGSVSVTASLPHPLYFNQPRQVQASASDYLLQESAVHADLAVTPLSGRTSLTLYAGGSFFSVDADLIDHLDYTQTYPFAAANVTLFSPAPRRLSNSPTGFNLGATLDFAITRNVGLGIQARYSRAKALFSAADSDSVEVTVGGVQVGGGLRLFF